MTSSIYNPYWINQFTHSEAQLEEIRGRLKTVTSHSPIITICVIAFNEERSIARCLDSLSRSVSSATFDIIVVNNNSTDRTQEILDNLEVTSYFQAIKGCGVSREFGQQNARGKYVLLADADCIYPRDWIEIMYFDLRKKGVVAVYGRHSFLGDHEVPRWKYALYDWGKDLVLELRNIKRPYLNAYGMSFGYVKELGLKEGFVTKNTRGEDGRLCFDLMKYGKVKLVRSNKSRVWTEARNFAQDGGLTQAVKKRLLRELVRFNEYFKTPVPHNTKTSQNAELTTTEYKQILKKRFGQIKRRAS